jgi:hypothetical protein
MQSNDPGAAAALAEAFVRPALKTAPDFCDSVAQAEAEGWVFDAALGRWNAPNDLLRKMKKQEKYAKSVVGKADDMTVEELQQALEKLVVGTRRSKSNAAAGDDDIKTLRRRVKERADYVRVMCRRQRKDQLVDTSASVVVSRCAACGKNVGKRLQKCSRCKAVAYCDAKCQKKHWKTHKAFCKREAERVRSLDRTGTDTAQLQHVMSWYSGVPNLAQGVLCQAWKHRDKSPLLRVDGGVNARLAKVTVVPRTVWGTLPRELNLDIAQRFAQADFHKDRCYFAVIHAGHPGTESWPAPTPRFRFPLPADEMDEYVAYLEAQIQKTNWEAKAKQRENNPWVQLTGLRNKALNGERGLRGAWDEQGGRYHVQLRSGKTVNVKPENLAYFEPPPEGTNGTVRFVNRSETAH